MTYSTEPWSGWIQWTPLERIVFSATVELKASYGFKEAVYATGITREEWETGRQALIDRGVFNRIGSVLPRWKKRYYSEPRAIHPSVSGGSKRERFETL